MPISRRWNKFWIGLTLGLVLPLVAFLLIYFIGYSKTNIYKFLEHAIMRQALTKIMSLCVLPNLAIFYFFLNKEYWYATRGVICSTLLYTLAILVILFIL